MAATPTRQLGRVVLERTQDGGPIDTSLWANLISDG